MQEVVRLALRRPETLETSFGGLVSGEVQRDGSLHAALLRALRDVARVDLGEVSKAEKRHVHGSTLYNHFPQHKWRIHQLSHVLCVALREAPSELQERMSDAEARPRAGGRGRWTRTPSCTPRPPPPRAARPVRLEGGARRERARVSGVRPRDRGRARGGGRRLPADRRAEHVRVRPGERAAAGAHWH